MCSLIKSREINIESIRLNLDRRGARYTKMAYINTVIKHGTAGPRWSSLCSAAAAPAAPPAGKTPIVASIPFHMADAHKYSGSRKLTSGIAMAPTWMRTFASGDSSKKDDVPRTASGEVQRQNNFASEVGKKMQEVAPGGDPAESASSAKGEQPKQERDKGGSK